MADTIELTDGTNTVNFLAATGLRGQPAWVPAVAAPTGDGSIPPYITEVIPVIVRNTSTDLMAADLQRFHLLQKTAAEYWVDQTAVTPVWFYTTVDNETNDRRAFVKSLAIEFRPGLGQLYECNVLDGVLAQVVIVRHPYWEALTAVTEVATAAISTLGGAYDYTAAPSTDVVGDVPARLIKLQTTYSDNQAAEYLWAGWRSALKHGTLANFVSSWAADDGVSSLADTTEAAGIVTCDFSTETSWAARWFFSMDAITANEEDNYGLFVVLMRAKVTSGTVEVKVEHEYRNQDAVGDGVFGETVEITNNDYALYNMGLRTFPLRNLKAIDTTMLGDVLDSKQYMRVWARRTSGAGSLLFERFLMIPYDEFFLYSEQSFSVGDIPRRYLISTSPHDQYEAVTYDDLATDVIATISPVAPSAGGYPIGDGRIYFAIGEGNQEMDTGKTVTVVSSYMPRWLSLRGAE